MITVFYRGDLQEKIEGDDKMEFKSDSSLKREIAGSIRMAAVIMTGAFQKKYQQPKFIENAAEDSLYVRLTKMIDEGEIGGAEDILWEQLEQGGTENFLLALGIYEYMNEKEEDFLEEHHFSREEIRDGVQYVMQKSHKIWF